MVNMWSIPIKVSSFTILHGVHFYVVLHQSILGITTQKGKGSVHQQYQVFLFLFLFPEKKIKYLCKNIVGSFGILYTSMSIFL